MLSRMILFSVSGLEAPSQQVIIKLLNALSSSAVSLCTLIQALSHDPLMKNLDSFILLGKEEGESG
jgi:hypothetical protein